jgi:GDPmannose 4,6-dehydratase
VRDFLAEVINSLHDLGAGDAAPQSIEEWVEVDRGLFRAGEIKDLRADARLARKELGWSPTVDFKHLVRMMVAADLEDARRRGTGASSYDAQEGVAGV